MSKERREKCSKMLIAHGCQHDNARIALAKRIGMDDTYLWYAMKGTKRAGATTEPFYMANDTTINEIIVRIETLPT